MAPQAEKAKSIFLDAAEIASDEERGAYVRDQVDGDEELRHEVESLLRHHGQLGSFLVPVVAPPLSTSPPPNNSARTSARTS